VPRLAQGDRQDPGAEVAVLHREAAQLAVDVGADGEAVDQHIAPVARLLLRGQGLRVVEVLELAKIRSGEADRLPARARQLAAVELLHHLREAIRVRDGVRLRQEDVAAAGVLGAEIEELVLAPGWVLDPAVLVPQQAARDVFELRLQARRQGDDLVAVARVVLALGPRPHAAFPGGPLLLERKQDRHVQL
jgi:hypothetical protein